MGQSAAGPFFPESPPGEGFSFNFPYGGLGGRAGGPIRTFVFFLLPSKPALSRESGDDFMLPVGTYRIRIGFVSEARLFRIGFYRTICPCLIKMMMRAELLLGGASIDLRVKTHIETHIDVIKKSSYILLIFQKRPNRVDRLKNRSTASQNHMNLQCLRAPTFFNQNGVLV